MNHLLSYLGGATALLWGIAHLVPTKNVVKDFGEISLDNQRIITMEWIVEGVSLMFIGALTISVTFTDPLSEISEVVYIFLISMLLLLAVISLFTGFKVNFLPFKLCPFIFTASAVLIFLGMIL